MRISIILAAMLFVAGSAEAQTVKCGNPRTLGQRLVCQNPDLRGFDRRNNGDYLRVITYAEPPDYFRIKRSQGRYLAARDACRSVSCLDRVFRKRSYELKHVLYEY